MNCCVLCDDNLDDGKPTVKLRQKGSDSINKASRLRGTDIETQEGQTVHVECRRTFINPNSIDASRRKSTNGIQEKQPQKRDLRSLDSQFDFQRDCIFCGQAGNKKQEMGMIHVRTETKFQDTIRNKCHERNDKWGVAVLSRLEYGRDCCARKAVYHNTGSVNFRTLKQIPVALTDKNPTPEKRPRAGRPEDTLKWQAFQHVVEWIEDNDSEQVTVYDLVEEMKKHLNDGSPYSVPYMKKRLSEHFGDRVVIAEVNGRVDVVTLKTNAASILHNSYLCPKEEHPDADKIRIIETSGDLIRNDIKSMEHEKDLYPKTEDLSSLSRNLKYLPESLQLFLRKLITGSDADIKIASIGQAIIQATRPRAAIPPLQIGLAVQMHHHFASRFLIDSLNHHGFCASYMEVKKFETNAAASQGTDIDGFQNGHFLQFVADNVDHNVRTLDGFNTFHGMGIIATTTPGIKITKPVPRAAASLKQVRAIGRIGVHFYKSEWNGLSSLKYEDLHVQPIAGDPTSSLDTLWKISWPLKSPRPCWTGLMQTIQQGEHPGESSVTFLPMIDMNPSDSSCVFSTLKFICNQSRKYKVTPIITFDQPLWFKAKSIISSLPSDKELQSIVLRLGAFHTEMSYLGCIGHLMADSGLRNVFETIYAPNAVTHMMTGKATARAIRAHFLVDTALNALLVTKAFDNPWTYMETTTDSKTSLSPLGTTNKDLQEATDLFEELMLGRQQLTEDICNHEALRRIEKQILEYRESVKSLRTSTLWFQYMNMVDILRRFLKSERTGNWKLHLQSVSDMLPYFAASGHNLYAKSARLYLQDMMQLENTHPEVFKSFLEGHHVVRRSDRFWAGLSTDLVIEQVLMRSLKTSGGLTRGRGMGEEQRLTWLLSMPVCAAYNTAMQNVTGLAFNTSDQHKDMTKARLQRDEKDIQVVHDYLHERNPFSEDPTLRNITSGEIADNSVNVDEAVQIGQKILTSMTGKEVLTASFRKKDQVVTLASKSSMKVDGEVVEADPLLLFQRLVTTAHHTCENLAYVFMHELCSFPPALFESSGLPRLPNKSTLADSMWATLKNPDWESPPVNSQVHIVLDGGALLQRVIWPRGSTYNDILQLYAEYVERKYGKVTVVFDGYGNGPSTKDITHLRRKASAAGGKVNFSKNMLLSSKKEVFLANESNKQKFIQLLGELLQMNGCDVKHSRGDADLLIVKSAVAHARDQTTLLIGDDTDLLVLLCYHAEPDSHDIYLLPEQKVTSKKQRKVWKIKDVQRILGPSICDNILFGHAFLGCDTTSRVFGVGKGVALKKLKSDSHFMKQAEVFTKWSTKDEVGTAGEHAMVSLYGGEIGTSLDELRLLRFREKVSSSTTFVQPHSLPPTTSATTQHSLRVYFQVQLWKDERVSEMIPQDWGWELRNERLVPVHTNMPPAPSHLLRVIRCNCKSDCASSRCSCRKHGLDCSPGCGECRGVSCTNSPQADFEGDAQDVLFNCAD